MLVDCSLSPVTREQWEQEGARLSKLQEFIPDGSGVSLDKLKTLGGKAIVLTCPRTSSTLTSHSAGSSCETNPDTNATLPSIITIGITEVQEIMACRSFAAAMQSRGTVEDINHALTFRAPTDNSWLWNRGAWT